jgi:hypothetical protein
MHKSRNLSARRVLVNDVALRRFHQLGLGTRHCLERCVAVTALDRFFDRSDRTTHLGAARFIDNGAAGNLAGRLLGGTGIGHLLKYPSAVSGRFNGRAFAPAVQMRDRRYGDFGCPWRDHSLQANVQQTNLLG